MILLKKLSMLMKKKIRADFFSQSNKWPRRIPKLRKITSLTIKHMKKYFKNDCLYNLNLIFSEKTKMTQLNKKYKNKYADTDVLTFVSKITNKNLGKLIYCDIFFSIDTIEKYINKNHVKIYDHFTHLLIHSLLHLNDYDHKNLIQFEKMKKQEIKILKKFKIKNPY